VMIRYCRHCDTEFQPHVVRCSDCGGELEDRHPDELGDDPPPAPDVATSGEGETAEGEFVTVARDLSPGKAELVARKLAAAAIPFRVGALGYGLRVAVREADQGAARTILLRARAIPRDEPGDQPAVAETGGPCPACGEPVSAGAHECPGCGLSLGSEAVLCDRCGAELDPPWEPCPRCAGSRPE
jgi:double zinc ribbon protein